MYLGGYSNGHDVLFSKKLMITTVNLIEKWESQNFFSTEYKGTKHGGQHLACSSLSKQGVEGN